MYSPLRKFAAGVSATAITLSSVMTMGVATAATSFTDAGTISTWASDAVTKLVDAGVLAGRPDGSFNPAGNLNRAEMAKVAVLGAGLSIDTTGAPHFADVKPSDWFYPYVETLYNNGVVGGINNGALDENGLATFSPSSTLNRAEAAKILNEAYDMETSYAGTPPNFPDVAKSAWFFDYAETAYAHGLLNGYADGRFGPADNITREQVAVVAQNGREEAGLVAGVNAGSKKRTGYTAGAASTVVADSDDTPDTPATGDGTLAISLSSKNPSGATVPSSAKFEMAAFDLTAASDDVVVGGVTFERSGLGAESEITSLVLVDEKGMRISRVKDGGFNNDDEVTFSMLSGGLTVDAGTTRTIRVFASTDATAAGRHALSLTAASAVTSNAKSVSGSFPITGGTFEGSSTVAGEVTLDHNNISPLKVGQKQVAIAKFELQADDVEDVRLQAITLKNEGGADLGAAVENAKLMFGTQTIATGSINDDFLSFVISNPVTIEEDQTEEFSVVADIIGEPGEMLNMDIESDIDVFAVGANYGFGVGVAGRATYNTASTAATIQAGEVTVTKTEPEDEFLADKDNVVLGTFNVITKEGAALNFEDFRATITSTVSGVTTLLDNIELFDVKTGRVYELGNDAANAADLTAVISDTGLGIALAGGETRSFQVRADTVNDSAVVSAATLKLTVTVLDGTPATSTGDGIVIEETTDDQQVTDITPSSITYRTMDGVASSIEVRSVVQSAALAAVKGTTGVEALVFEVEAGDASALTLDEVTVLGRASSTGAAIATTAGGDANVSRTYLNSVSLYEVGNNTPLDTISGSLIADGEAEFDGFTLTIAKNATKRFVVKYDLVDSTTIADDTVRFFLTNLSIEDADGDDIDVTAVGQDLNTAIASARTVTVQGSGTLVVEADDTDAATNRNKWVLGGATSEFVTSFELTADNEAVQINDLVITNETDNLDANGVTTEDMSDAVAEVILYKNDKTTEIARKSVSSDTVTFNDINYVAPEGSSNIYVKVVAHGIGKNLAGAQLDGMVLSMEVTDAEGDASGETDVFGNVGDETDTSNLSFGVIPVQVSAISFASSQSGTSMPSTLTNGEQVLAILGVTTTASANTDADDGSSLETALETLVLNVDYLDNGAALSDQTQIANWSIERIGGADSKQTAAGTWSAGAQDADGSDDVTFDLVTVYGDAGESDNKIANGTTAYFIVRGEVTKNGTTDNDDFVKVELDGLNSGDVVYSSDDTGTNISALRLGTTTISAAQLTE